MSWYEFLTLHEILVKLSINGWILTNDMGNLKIYHREYGAYSFSNKNQFTKFIDKWNGIE